jgi:broad specificity phosphatase PhoE
MKIYLVRHGESVDDVEDCYGGIADFPLSENGRNTAKELAARLEPASIEVLYSSPYARALETAQQIVAKLGCQLVVINELKERNSYGVLSGHNKERAKSLFSEIFSGIKGKPGDYYGSERVIGDESTSDFDKRVAAAFQHVVTSAKGKSVIGIVTHGNVTRSIYRNILKLSGKIELDLLAITVISSSPDGFSIVSSEGVSVK